MATDQQGSPDWDRQVAERLARGDERALAEIYDRLGATAFSLARAIVGDDADAEEVVADAFAQVWRSAGRFDSTRGGVAAWVHTITRSRALDLLRSRRRRTELLRRAANQDEEGLALPLSAPEGASGAVERHEIRDRVQESLRELPEAQRVVIEMAYFGGRSQSEIAADLEEPLGTIKTRMRSGMEKLRRSLASLGLEADR